MTTPPADLARSILRRCAAGRVRQISRVITAHFDSQFRELGMTANQLTILSLITVLGPSRSSDIEPFLAMEQSTLSRNLARMVDHGWLAKVEDEVDARSYLLSVTASGEALLADAYLLWEPAQEWAEDLLGKTGIDGISRVARKVNPHMP